jgi:hypothetical protein
MKTKEMEIQAIKNRIDDYINTVYAIIGFLNTYKFELGQNGKEISLFQGRKLYLDTECKNYVTPDFGLLHETKNGVVGEVKYSFPENQKFWKDDFDQLKKYEGIQSGWPNENGKANNFDIVLLVQQNRSRSVKDYYLSKIEEDHKLKRPFAIVEFNRASQGKEFFHFRIEHGILSDTSVYDKFYKGVYVSFEIFLSQYATIKIYDVEPPLPLMLLYIYECVVDQAKNEDGYKKLTKKSVQKVTVNAHELATKLNKIYSFKRLQSAKYSQHQPEFPKLEWVKKALNELFRINEGIWLDKNKGIFQYYLSRKEESLIDHYIIKTIGASLSQPELF